MSAFSFSTRNAIRAARFPIHWDKEAGRYTITHKPSSAVIFQAPEAIGWAAIERAQRLLMANESHVIDYLNRS